MIFWVMLASAHASAPELRRTYADELPIWMDYADELLPEDFAVVGEETLDDGRRRITVAFSIRNTTGAAFDRIVALPDLTGEPGLETIRAAAFGAVGGVAGPHHTASADVAAIIEADASWGSTAAVLGALELAPVVVLAGEVNQITDDVTFWQWTLKDATAYEDAQNVPADPFGSRPWDPTETFTLRLFYPTGAPADLVDLDLSTQRRFFVGADDVDLSLLPEGFHYFEAETMEVEDAGMGQFVVFTGHVTDATDLTEVYDYATFSTTMAGQIGSGPVGATRISEIDGETLPPEVRDVWTQPLPFNALPLFDGAVTAWGTVHAHALKPSLTVVVRPDETRWLFRFETEASLAVQLRVDAAVAGSDDHVLGSLCFPLPPLTFGPVQLPQRVQTEQRLTLEAELAAGTVLDLQHGIQHAFTLTCVDDDQGLSCSSATEVTGGPLHVTPPQLTSYAEARANLGTQLDATLWLGGAPYPDCTTGFRASLHAGLGVGMKATPLVDPRIEVEPTHTLEGSADLELLGLELLNYVIGGQSGTHDQPWTHEPVLPDPMSGARYLTGEDQRWMVAIDQFDKPNPTVAGVTAAPLADGGAVVAAAENGAYRLLRLDAYGVLLDVANLKRAPRRSPQVVIPDNGTVLIGGLPAWMASTGAEDLDGALQWANDYAITDGSAPYQGLLSHTSGLDDFGSCVAVGQITRAPRDDDAWVARFDDTGGVVWAKLYEGPGHQRLHGSMVASNGDLVVVGRTEAGPDPFSLDNAWVMRLDADDGSVVWSKALVSHRRTGELHQVVEGSDGALYAVGSQLRDVTRTGASFVARVEPDGSDAIHALLVQGDGDVWVGEELGPFSLGVEDTAYDTFTAIAASGDSVVVAGHAGNVERTAWLASLGRRLEPEWFQSFDSKGADVFTSVHAIDDGLLVAGHTAALGAEQHVFLGTFAALAGTESSGGGDLTGWDAASVMAGVRDSSGSLDVVPDEQVLIDAPVSVVDASVEVFPLLAQDLFEPTPTPECVTLLTPTGRPTLADPCPDEDRASPVVRILAPSPGARYLASEPVPIRFVIADEFGVDDWSAALDTGRTFTGNLPEVDDQVVIPSGVHTLTVRGTDAAGHETTASVTFEVFDDGAPDAKDTGDRGPGTPAERTRACGCHAEPAPGWRVPGWLLPWWGLGLLLLRRRRGEPDQAVRGPASHETKRSCEGPSA